MRRKLGLVTYLKSGGAAPTVTLPQNLIISSAQIEDFEVIDDWTANASMAVNTSEKKTGAQSIKLTTPTGTTAGALLHDAISPNLNLSGYNRFTLWAYIHDKTKLSATNTLRIEFYTPTSANAWRATVLASGLDNGWNALNYRTGEFTVGAGTPNWATVGAFNYRVVATTGLTADISFDNLIGVTSAKPAACICFDDEFSTLYDICFPIMRAHNIKGTLYVRTSNVGGAGYMTWAQIRELRDAGWIIANHTRNHTNLTTLSEADQETEILAGESDLLAEGCTDGDKYLAYPGGTWNDDTLTAMSNLGYLTGRTTIALTGKHTLLPLRNNYEIECQDVLGVSLATTQGYIDTAITNQEVVTLLWHRLNGGGEWTTADFTSFIEYLVTKKADIASVTIADLYNLLSGPVTVPDMV